jgi:hypothetical protein
LIRVLAGAVERVGVFAGSFGGQGRVRPWSRRMGA